MEAIGRVDCPIAWLPPGHDPGAGVGVALLPESGPLWPWGILDRRRDLRVAKKSRRQRRRRGGAMESDSSGRGDSCRTERTQLGSRKARSAYREREARAAGPATRRREGRDPTRSDVTGRDWT